MKFFICLCSSVDGARRCIKTAKSSSFMLHHIQSIQSRLSEPLVSNQLPAPTRGIRHKQIRDGFFLFAINATRSSPTRPGLTGIFIPKIRLQICAVPSPQIPFRSFSTVSLGDAAVMGRAEGTTLLSRKWRDKDPSLKPC